MQSEKELNLLGNESSGAGSLSKVKHFFVVLRLTSDAIPLMLSPFPVIRYLRHWSSIFTGSGYFSRMPRLLFVGGEMFSKIEVVKFR